jgi:hypothetical protein
MSRLALAALLATSFASAHADVLLVTTTADAGAGSLRAALAAAVSGDEIHFDIPVQQLGPIQPTSQLPPLAAGVTLDGSTQSGASCASWPPALWVEIDGSQAPPAPPSTHGLVVGGDGAVVRGLVIRGFPGHGIRVASANQVVVECCFVGTDRGGSEGDANTGNGISLEGAGGARIGGDVAAGRSNLISGNLDGVRIDATSSGNEVLGNFIGTDWSGTLAIGNGGAGVDIAGGALNTIGALGAGNVLRFNGGGAVVVSGAGAAGNSIRGNVIAQNGAHGIDLIGALLEDANDPLDADAGPNRLQNWPEMDAVLYAVAANQLTARFSVPTAPTNATYPLAVDFYVADDADEEGEVYLGTATYSAAEFGGGAVTKSFVPQGAVQPGDRIVATATDAAGNTSEFADDFAVVPEAGAGSGAAVLAALVAVAHSRATRAQSRPGRAPTSTDAT